MSGVGVVVVIRFLCMQMLLFSNLLVLHLKVDRKMSKNARDIYKQKHHER
jgi:hypothetical protein